MVVDDSNSLDNRAGSKLRTLSNEHRTPAPQNYGRYISLNLGFQTKGGKLGSETTSLRDADAEKGWGGSQCPPD